MAVKTEKKALIDNGEPVATHFIEYLMKPLRYNRNIYLITWATGELLEICRPPSSYYLRYYE